MKVLHRMVRLVAGRWMRRLVWAPAIVLGAFLLGAKLQLRAVPNPTYAMQPTIAIPQPSRMIVSTAPERVRNEELERERLNYESMAAKNKWAQSPQPSFTPTVVTAHSMDPLPRMGLFSDQAPQPQFGSTAPYFPTRLATEILSAADDKPKLAKLLREMLELSIKQFDEGQASERAKLSKEKNRLAIWETGIEKRQSLKRQLVESMIAKSLKSPDILDWTYSGNTPQSAQVLYQELLDELWNATVQPEVESIPADDGTGTTFSINY